LIIDPTREDTAYREALATGVEMVAMIDSNGDPEGISYVIPANDDASQAVKLVVTTVMKAIEEGTKLAKKGGK
jgi:small subunit ribosomal protein S2